MWTVCPIAVGISVWIQAITSVFSWYCVTVLSIPYLMFLVRIDPSSHCCRNICVDSNNKIHVLLVFVLLLFMSLYCYVCLLIQREYTYIVVLDINV